MITMPREFKQYCQTLKGVIDEAPTSGEELVEVAVRGVQREWILPITRFLDDVLASYSSEELDAWWWTTPGPLSFRDPGDCKRFLTLVRARLALPPFNEN